MPATPAPPGSPSALAGRLPPHGWRGIGVCPLASDLVAAERVRRVAHDVHIVYCARNCRYSQCVPISFGTNVYLPQPSGLRASVVSDSGDREAVWVWAGGGSGKAGGDATALCPRRGARLAHDRRVASSTA